jgi:hypothetical protein
MSTTQEALAKCEPRGRSTRCAIGRLGIRPRGRWREQQELRLEIAQAGMRIHSGSEREATSHDESLRRRIVKPPTSRISNGIADRKNNSG